MKQKRMIGFVGMLIMAVLILHGTMLVLALPDQVKDEKQWRESIIQHRQQKDAEFKTSPTSPMAAVNRLVVKPGAKTFVIETNRRITLSQQQEPGVQFSLVNQNGQWFWEQLTPGVTGKAANKPVAPGSSLNQYTLFQGDKYALQGDDSDILFIPFGDKTNDKETYGSGRFLEIHEPRETNFILDFNLCFNPLCNYSADAYNCPLPPFENILGVHIYAGEKTYPH